MPIVILLDDRPFRISYAARYLRALPPARSSRPGRRTYCYSRAPRQPLLDDNTEFIYSLGTEFQLNSH